jgi:hypothetical protein
MSTTSTGSPLSGRSTQKPPASCLACATAAQQQHTHMSSIHQQV